MKPKPGNVVPIREQTEPGVQNAKVVSVSGKEAVIRISGVTHAAKIAFSCLIRPEPGDQILCTKNETGAHYILGIIERPGSRNMTLSFPADATLQAEDGSLQMLSRKSVTMIAGDQLNCFSGQAIHKSREAVVDFDKITANGTSLQANFKTVRLISQMVNTMAKQMIEKVKSYIRHTEDYDQVNAGQMTRKVGGLYSMDSRHTVMVSKKDTKIDGERIHMG